MNHKVNINVDITPWLINKTGIARVIEDLYSHWLSPGTYKVNYYILGIPIKFFDKNTFKIKFFRKIFLHSIKFPFFYKLLTAIVKTLYRFKNYSDQKKKLLIFDPLYIDFYPIDKINFVFCLDLTPITHPEWHNSIVSELYNKVFNKLSQSKIKILCISKNTQENLHRLFPITSKHSKIIDLYLPIKINNLLKQNKEIYKQTQRDSFFLYVGNFEPRKNLSNLISAFLNSQSCKLGWKLKIIGSGGHKEQDIIDLCKNHSEIELLGFTSDQELVDNYYKCGAFVFPSLLEGFGIPLIEAWAFSCPLIVSNTGSLNDLAPLEAIKVDPSSVESIQNGMDLMAQHPKLPSQLNFDYYSFKRFSSEIDKELTSEL